MYFSVFVPKFNIFNIFVKFSIFMQNLQYLYKSSIFVLNLQYLYICVLFSSLWSVYKRIYPASGVRERDYCSGFVLFVSKSSILHICSYIGFFSSLCSVYKQIYLASGVRERENSYLFAFSYFCTLFKSFVNW